MPRQTFIELLNDRLLLLKIEVGEVIALYYLALMILNKSFILVSLFQG